MPAEFVKCVDALIKQGKSKDSAYAICTTQYKQRHKGNTPQQDEEKASLDEIVNMGKFYEEVVAARKKRTFTHNDMKNMMKNYFGKGY